MTLPAEPKLAAVSSRVIVTKACALALAEPRVQSDVVRSLVAQATELLTSSAKASSSRSKTAGAETKASAALVTSPLFDALGVDLQAAIRDLQALLTEAEAVTQQLDLSDAPENAVAALGRLRALKIITAEEEYFEFIQVNVLRWRNPVVLV